MHRGNAKTYPPRVGNDGSIPAIKLSTYTCRLNSGSEVTQDDRNLQNVNSLQRNKGSEFSCMIKEAKVLGMALGIACLDGSGSLFEVYLLLSVGKHWDC
nr:flap endonuclease GEN-like 2 [Quercus suber]